MNNDVNSGSAVVIRSLPPNAEALGMILSLLAENEPFSAFALGAVVGAVREQLLSNNHVVALQEGAIAGYAGWSLTQRAMAQLWMEGLGQLKAVAGPSDAAVLTVVVSANPLATRALLREARRLNPGRQIFFKRGYDGDIRPAKKQTVRNVTF